MNVVIADNGQMALEKLRENKSIELIIMDIMMPVMDGYEAMRAIGRRGRFGRCRSSPYRACNARRTAEMHGGRGQRLLTQTGGY